MPQTGAAKIATQARYRARQRGEDVPLRVEHWTDDEVTTLRAAYERSHAKTGWLAVLSQQLGRSRANVCRKARSNGPNKSGPTR